MSRYYRVIIGALFICITLSMCESPLQYSDIIYERSDRYIVAGTVYKNGRKEANASVWFHVIDPTYKGTTYFECKTNYQGVYRFNVYDWNRYRYRLLYNNTFKEGVIAFGKVEIVDFTN